MAIAAQDKDTIRILDMLRAYHAAMVAARTDTLGALLEGGFSLTHITGYVQPREEWFDVIRSGEFDYHAIDVDERSLSLDIAGDAATLRGKGVFEATINGTRAPWRLRFTMSYARRDGGWKVVSARYTGF